MPQAVGERLAPLPSTEQIGGNQGNLLYQFSTYRALAAENVALTPLTYGKFDKGDLAERAEWINSECDHLVLPLSSSFRLQMLPNLKRWGELIERLTIPVTVVGIGAQLRLADVRDKNYVPSRVTGITASAAQISEHEDASRRFVAAVLDRSHSIGVRGEISKAYLQHLGFPSAQVDVIGCPSLFMAGPQLHRIRDEQPKLTARSRLSLSFDHRITATADLLDATVRNFPKSVVYAQEKMTAEMVITGEETRPDWAGDPRFPVHRDHQLFQQHRMEYCPTGWSWIRHMGDYDFAFGPRLHGTVAATLAGTSAHLLVHDSRTLEVAEFHGLPHTLIERIDEIPSAGLIVQRQDYARFHAGYAALFDNFIDFLRRNDLRSGYDDGGTALAAFDASIAKPTRAATVVSAAPEPRPEGLLRRLKRVARRVLANNSTTRLTADSQRRCARLRGSMATRRRFRNKDRRRYHGCYMPVRIRGKITVLKALAVACSLILATTTVTGSAVAQAAPLPQEAVRAKASLKAPDVTPLQDPVAVKPDVAYTSNGTRIEIYSSVGDNDGGIDWRQVNQYAYLISSVPKGSQLYSTVYNTLWDGDKATYNAVTKQWDMFNSAGEPKVDGMYSPTKAFQTQINQYTSNGEDPNKYLHILGSRSTINDALAAGSGLSSLLTQALKVKFCSHGFGACLSTTTDEELMHAKYAAFSKAKDSTGKLWDNVTWVTSANLNGASGGRKSNLSIAVFGDPKAYSGIVNTVYDAEVKQTFTPAFKAAMSKGIQATNPNLVLYPSPRTDVLNGAAPDHEANFLASRLNSRIGGTKTSCKAYSVHSLFSQARTAIMTNLAALQSEGCSVKIVLGENALADIVDTYFSMSTSLRQLIDRVEFGNVHDKTLTLSYTLKGVPVGTAFGGSANFNGTSLRYDELAFKLADLTATRAIEQQSERLYLLAKGGGTVIPVSTVSLSPGTATIAQGKTLKLKAYVTPSNASVRTVTWSSTNESVATVSTNGTVTGVKPGTATIQALSVSGAHLATATVTVGAPNSTTTPPDNTPDGNLVVSSAPVLTMPVYQPRTADGGRTTVVVTWGQGDVDIAGSVSLQYYTGSSWHTYSTFSTNSIGRAKKVFAFKSSHTWRVRANSVSSPRKASISSTATYSKGYSLITVKTSAASGKPKLYAPNMAASTGTVPFLIVWKGRGTVKLQYLIGTRTWVTKTVYTFATGNQIQVGVIITSHRSGGSDLEGRLVVGLREGRLGREPARDRRGTTS